MLQLYRKDTLIAQFTKYNLTKLRVSVLLAKEMSKQESKRNKIDEAAIESAREQLKTSQSAHQNRFIPPQ